MEGKKSFNFNPFDKGNDPDKKYLINVSRNKIS